MTSASKKSPNTLVVSAIAFKQGDTPVYSFAMPGSELTKIADFSRLKRDESGNLEGFQRHEIQQHVKQIADYLTNGPSLFPNAIILAISPQVKFTGPRGPGKETSHQGTRPGYLTLPIKNDGEKVAWIVDGQQRSLALAKANRNDLLVPVVAFVASSLEVQRQQFILVNRAKPLSQRLVNELLPETENMFLPKDLAANKIPSQLCSSLHEDPKSPFHTRIDRQSAKAGRQNSFTDTAIIQMIRERINNPVGALAHLKGFDGNGADLNEMYRVLVAYWSAVAETFPDAWDLPPEQSRLTHGAGIRAMGALLDRIASRINLEQKNLKASFKNELAPIKSKCAWTKGRWPLINLSWNAIEVTTRSVNELTRVLNSLYMEASRS